jgi:hypothetical protein
VLLRAETALDSVLWTCASSGVESVWWPGVAGFEVVEAGAVLMGGAAARVGGVAGGPLAGTTRPGGPLDGRVCAVL